MTAITVGNDLLEKVASNSIDATTITEKANQDVATLLKKIDSDLSVGRETAEFVKAQGEVTRAIIELQEALIRELGPAISEILKALATLINWTANVIPYLIDAIDAYLSTNVLTGPLYFILKSIVSLLGDIADNTSDDDVFGNANLEQSIMDFFGGQSQFAGSGFAQNVSNFINPQGT